MIKALFLQEQGFFSKETSSAVVALLFKSQERPKSIFS